MTGNDKITAGTYSHDAGIIPRTLYQLFSSLSMEGIDAAIKCSFIELYNEELRDLISDDDSKKITITDAGARLRKSTGVTRGQESVFISSAAHGLEVLQHGLRKRQVAETKMNDLSSRSHTIFTLTVYMGLKNGQTQAPETLVNDACVIGKINLVDLAGSENIGKSGAENKRAREAGMINQSLLTLGRVINALVDKSPHIPYRESKLTRLLQDSLGGQTRTCIIATISPAQINLEETLSTLEYASKAKSIKNKAQVGSLVSKTTMFKEWADDFIRLRRDWDATRKKNGTYLTEEHYKELLSENDERQLRIEEQQRKLMTVDSQLKSSREVLDSTKVQLIEAKKQLTSTSNTLSTTMSSLANTEEDLKNTKSSLTRETRARKAHAQTEASLAKIGADLISKLDTTVASLSILYDTVDRHDRLDLENEQILAEHGQVVNSSYTSLEKVLAEYGDQTSAHMTQLQTQIASVQTSQQTKINETVSEIDSLLDSLTTQCQSLESANTDSEAHMAKIVAGLDGVRTEIKNKISEGLGGLGSVSQEMAQDLANQVNDFKTSSHQLLDELAGKCKGMFAELQTHSQQQAKEIGRLNSELVAATRESVKASGELVHDRVSVILQEEAAAADRERAEMVALFTKMIADREQQQQSRLQAKIQQVQTEFGTNQTALTSATDEFEVGMNQLEANEHQHQTTLSTHETALAADLAIHRKTTDSHAQAMDSAGDRLTQDLRDVLQREVAEVGDKLASFDTFANSVTTAATNERNELTQRYMHLDEGVRSGLAQVQAGLDQLGSATGAPTTAVQTFGTEVQQAWTGLTTQAGEIVDQARQKVEEVKYVRDLEPRGERVRVEYPAVMPVTGESPTYQQQQSQSQQQQQERSPLSDISQARNEVPSGGATATVGDIKTTAAATAPGGGGLVRKRRLPSTTTEPGVRKYMSMQSGLEGPTSPRKRTRSEM